MKRSSTNQYILMTPLEGAEFVDLIEVDLDEEEYQSEDNAVSDEPRTIPVGVNNNVVESGNVGLELTKIKDEVQDLGIKFEG